MLCLTPLYMMQLKLHLLDTAGKTAEASNSAIDAKSITEKAKIQETQKSKTIFNCQTTRFVLCHGDKGSRKIKPILSIDGFPKTFDKKLKQLLINNKVEIATKIQEYMWPIVSKTYSLIAIGPKSSGKSYGYLIPMVDTIIRTLEESRIKLRKLSNTAPLAVVLCPSWKVVLQTEEMLKTVERELKQASGRTALQGQYLRIISVFEGEHKLRQNVALINGCQILITTPPSLLRMMNLPQEQVDMQGNVVGTNLQMCSHLVFENADQMFEKYDVEIATVMSLFKSSRMKEKERRDKMKMNSSMEMFDQFIITSRRWCDSLEKFVRTFVLGEGKVGPYFCFYDHLEAAVYGKAKIASYMLEAGPSKLQKVKDIIYSYDLKAHRKILIHVNNESAVQQLRSFLESNIDDRPKIVPFFLSNDETSALETREIISIWKQTSENDDLDEYYPLILADTQDIEPLGLFQTDEYYSDDLVIMYDLPENSKKSFSQRFSHMSNSFTSFYGRELPIKDTFEKPSCHILITSQDRDKLKSIYMFLKRLSARHKKDNPALPLNLTELYRTYQEEDAKRKSGEDFCINIKMFGRCDDKRTCPFRHYIVPLSDFENSVIAKENVQIDDLDKCGTENTIEYDVVTVNSASHYYVRLKRSKDKSGKVVRDFGKSYVRLGMKLGCLEESDLEEIPKELYAVYRNELVLVKDKESFKRAKIISKVSFMSKQICNLSLECD